MSWWFLALAWWFPHLLRLFPRLPKVSVKRFVEPLIVTFAGGDANEFNEPLAGYLWFAAACRFISTNLDDRRQHMLPGPARRGLVRLYEYA